MKVENLVVDTTAFINNVQLQEVGVNLYTVREVVEEVRCKRQLRRLIVLPYDLQVRDVQPGSLSFVRNIAIQTGDIKYLSMTDLKLIALTYQLEVELVGEAHLRRIPKVAKILEPKSDDGGKIPGFYNGSFLKPDLSAAESGHEAIEAENVHDLDEDQTNASESVIIEEKNNKPVLCDDNTEDGNTVQEFDKEICSENTLTMHQKVLQLLDSDDLNGICGRFAALSSKELDYIEEKERDETEDHDDDPCVTDPDSAGWITPNNLRNKNSLPDNDIRESSCMDSGSAVVACVTTDFSLQNVLKQIGLNILSLDGQLIKGINTYLLRCYGCFHVTPQTTRIFCPKCGNKTLKKVLIRVDSEGNQYIQINTKRPISARGKKFPLPRPKGGKHAVNPILCEDQRLPQQRLSKLAMTKNNPMDPDYIAGSSPFVMRDISSRSAILGGIKKEEKYWMRKNPNEVTKRRRK